MTIDFHLQGDIPDSLNNGEFSRKFYSFSNNLLESNFEINQTNQTQFLPSHLETNPISIPIPIENEILIKEQPLFRKLALGKNHSLLLTHSQRLYSKGTNIHGQLGIGTTEPSPYEWVGPIAENVIDCSVGLYHSLFVTTDGSVFSIGRNYEGQCGSPALKLDYYEPHRIQTIDSIPDKIYQVSCGAYHSILLSENGICYSFGRGIEGQLGILGHLKSSIKGISKQKEQNQSENTNTNTNIDNASTYENNSTSNQTKKILTNPRVNITKKLKDRTESYLICRDPPSMRIYLQQQSIPKPVKCLEPLTSLVKKRRPFVNIKQIGCGERYTSFLSDDGRVFMCGDGRTGVLGLSKSSFVYNPQLLHINRHIPPIEKPKRIITIEFEFLKIPPPPKPKIVDQEDEVEVYRDEDCTFKLKNKFDLSIWSQNLNDLNSISNPNDPSDSNIDSPKIISIAIGWNHALLLDEEGEIYSSGWNSFGQCGLGHRNTVKVFTKIEKSKALTKDPIVQIGCGSTYSILLTQSGMLYVLGRLPGERSKSWGTNGDYLYPTALQYFKRNNQKVVHAFCGENELILEVEAQD